MHAYKLQPFQRGSLPTSFMNSKLTRFVEARRPNMAISFLPGNIIFFANNTRHSETTYERLGIYVCTYIYIIRTYTLYINPNNSKNPWSLSKSHGVCRFFEFFGKSFRTHLSVCRGTCIQKLCLLSPQKNWRSKHGVKEVTQ